MNQVIKRLQQTFDPDALAAWVATVLPRVVAAVIIFTVFFLAWKALDRGLAMLRRRTRLDPTLGSFIHTSLKYVLLTVALLTALGELGVNTASLLTSLGIVGLTIGFAAKDTLSNVISGLFIFWDRPFVIDDLIEVDGKYGRVAEITLRSTRVVTPDGKMLAIPNTNVVNSTVASYTNFPHLRLELDLTVGVEEDLDRVRRIFLELVEGDERFMGDPAPQMVVSALNDYNVAVQLRVWLDDEKDHIAVRFALREKVFEAMRAAGVEMPFQTFQLAPGELGRLTVRQEKGADGP